MSKRDRKKRKNSGGGEASDYGSSGVMGSLRGGMKRVAGTGPQKIKRRTTAQRAWDIAFWVIVLAALIFFLSRRF